MSCIRKCLLPLTVTLLVTRQVIAQESDLVEQLPASKKQIEFLVSDVCSVLDISEDFSEESCMRNFRSTNKTRKITHPTVPSKANFTCRRREHAMFKIEPNEEKQIFVLIPYEDYITFDIVDGLEENVTIDLPESDNHTAWSAILYSDGSTSLWRRGPDVPPWKEHKYNVSIEHGPVFEQKYNSRTMNTTFKLHFSGDYNQCSLVKVLHRCDKEVLGQNFGAEIPAKDQSLTIPDVTLNDNCELKLKMNENNKVLLSTEYATFLCDSGMANSSEPVPAKDIVVEAEASWVGWGVLVRWGTVRPECAPLKYEVTLLAPDVNRTIEVNGTTTAVIFEDVVAKDGDYYTVTIVGYTSNGMAYTNRRAQFHEHSNHKLVIVTGSLSISLTLVAAVIGFLEWWKRRKTYDKLQPRDITTHIQKLPKDCVIELSQESSVEDGWEVRSERLLLHEVIGEGAFGVVRKGTLSPGGREVAVKMLKEFPTLDEIRSFREEMELMKSVGAHPHVVSLVGCCSGRRLLIVTEYCSRGDLLSFLRCSWDVMVSKRNAKYYNNNPESSDYRNDLFKKQKDQSKLTPLVVNKLYDLQGICDSELTPLDLLSFCRQIAMGMEFLASNRVVHRDLAARNILVTGKLRVKIADFGLSRDVYQENQYKQKGNGKMPVKWMALESLTHRIYTTQSDVWSFGVVMWEVVTVGGAPYPGVPAARLPRLLRAGYRMPRPNNCSKQLYELMTSCWRARPRERPTFSELHAALDELLHGASDGQYLSLELDIDAPPTPRPQRYLRMLLRGARGRNRGETYERPLKGLQSNHYTSPPASLAKIQVV